MLLNFMGPPALFPTLLFLNSNRHLNMSVGCEIATLPSTDKNISCKSIPWQVMRPRPEPMILLWVPFFIFSRTEPNRTSDRFHVWSVDARVDEWGGCINISIFIERNIKLFHKKIKVHEGEKIYGGLLLLRKVVGGVRNVENDKRMWRWKQSSRAL